MGEEKSEKKERSEKKLKSESKEELKDEMKEEIDELFGDLAWDADVIYPDTETEYDDEDLEQYPTTIFVESSTSAKVDGEYRRLPKASRGKPAYMHTRKEKPTFFYWRKDKWFFGQVFGSSRSTAQTKDAGCFPTEPYP